MTPVPLKLKLGKLIKSSLIATGLKQTDLAQHLQISASAVSQMLNGKTAPNAVHLNKIFKLLDCHDSQVFMMRDLLSRIRSGMYELHSPVNDFFRSARKRQGLSQAKLASLSNIPTAELRLLENCSTVIPSKEQIISLAEILKFDIGDINQIINGLPQQNISYEEKEQSLIQIPVLSLEDIFKFNPILEDIITYVSHHCKKNFSLQFSDGIIDSDNTFGILAHGSSFNPSLPGIVRLIVTMDNLPDINDVVIAKLKNTDKLQLKRFTIKNDNIHLMPFSGITYQQDSKEDIEWLRKVLKVIISDFPHK